MKTTHNLLVLLLALVIASCGTGKKGNEEEASTEQNAEALMEESKEMDAAEDASVEDEGTQAAVDESSYTDASGRLVYLLPDVNPEFPGGEKALNKYFRSELKYPESAEENGIEGRVVVQFVVDESGSVQDVEVVEPAEDESLNEEAIRVVKEMPAWTPATKNGEPVNAQFKLPVNFTIL